MKRKTKKEQICSVTEVVDGGALLQYGGRTAVVLKREKLLWASLLRGGCLGVFGCKKKPQRK